ncbi:MAG: DNA gyrase/topoisomerase IV subunit A, partial [Bacteroidota bacterium]
YNMAYLDAASGRTYVKRFNVSAITRDREYDLTKGAKGSKATYFTANPNGESEIIQIQLTQGAKAKIKQFDFDFGELAIKGRSANGNILTKYPVRKITQKEVGQSTLGALKIYMDEVSGRLNTEERGLHLGDFDTGDQILVIYKDGSYELTDFELTNRYEPKEIMHIGKFDPEAVVSAVYFEGNKAKTAVKRFKIETTTQGQRFPFITDHKVSKLYFATLTPNPRIKYSMRVKGQKLEEEVDLAAFIDVKGWKSVGNKLSDHKLSKVEEIQIQVGDNGQTELTWNIGKTDD